MRGRADRPVVGEGCVQETTEIGRGGDERLPRRSVSGTPTANAITVEHPIRSQKENDSPTCWTLNTACTM